MTTYATLHTNHGDIRIELFPDHAPKTVRNFVGLADGSQEWTDPRSGAKPSTPLYDGVVFHRVIAGFMIQGGDPLGTGTGGPGYRFGDEFHPELQFNRPYLLAMANSGPGTNGSQFFITVAPTPWLNMKHTIFGEVADAESRAVVDAIAAVPVGAHGPAEGRRRHHQRHGRECRRLTPRGSAHGGPGLLPAPRPRDLHPLHAVRATDLPGLHDQRCGRLPVPRVRGRGPGRGARGAHPASARARSRGRTSP